MLSKINTFVHDRTLPRRKKATCRRWENREHMPNTGRVSRMCYVLKTKKQTLTSPQVDNPIKEWAKTWKDISSKKMYKWTKSTWKMLHSIWHKWGKSRAMR